MRTVSRLRLLLFSFYDYRCRAVHSVTLCPVETMQAHQKYNPVSYVSICYGHIDYTFGGPGGIRTPVQNTFLFASYSNNLQYIFIFGVCQAAVGSDGVSIVGAVGAFSACCVFIILAVASASGVMVDATTS